MAEVNPATVGVIVAGGRATRMGGEDKCRILVGGRPVVRRILDVVGPQVLAVALNANGDAGRFADLGVPVLGDAVPGQVGPLAGVLAGMEWAAGLGVPWVLTVPGDTPFLPGDLVARLHAARGGGEQACAATGEVVHPVVAVWAVARRGALRDALLGGLRRVRGFGSPAVARWPAGAGDPFLNLNSPADVPSGG